MWRKLKMTKKGNMKHPTHGANRRSLNLLAVAAVSFVLFFSHHGHHLVHGFSHHVAIIPRSRSQARTRSDYGDGGVQRINNRLPSLRPAESVLTLHSAADGAVSDNNNNNVNKLTEREIDQSMEYLAQLIKHRLQPKVAKPTNNDSVEDQDDDQAPPEEKERDIMNLAAYQLAKGRFVDLTSTFEGEQLLENLFLHNPTMTMQEEEEGDHPPGDGGVTTDTMNIDIDIDSRLVKFAISTLQSLLIYAMQIGVKGSEESQKKMVRHLFRPGDGPPPKVPGKWTDEWDSESIRRLKYYSRDNLNLGKLLLAKLIRKRTAQGAFDLVVDLGAWSVHEDTALLRSGFPVRFLEDEERVAKDAEESRHDPDALLRLRKDLRQFKVYTVDSASTMDIDDGISVEVMDDGADTESGEQRHRYWIHIADVDRWAPRGSELLKVAERRGTSLYLPSMTLNMFPENMASRTMSLESWEDKYALSLGVELNSTDGSIIPSSIILTPSLIHVDYRLTYDQVDEMLDEGVGYTEEWQIGALLAAATKRRAHRVERGSTEGMVPFPIPRGMVTAAKKKTSSDEESGSLEYDVSLKIETSHNSGANMTTGGETMEEHYDPYCSPVSSSQLIVTEMMILAGEAIGKWQELQPRQEVTELDDGTIQVPNVLELPFRRQPAPEFKSRQTEKGRMDFLFANEKRYPHAWYARRFFNKVTVSEEPGPHFGMGLDCYVQWTSPIRRLTDVQVHSALKRYLRRKRVNLMLERGVPIPSEITSMDLGCDIPKLEQTPKAIDPIDYTSGLGMIFAARPIQSSSSNYWLFEYIRQLVDKSDEEVMFESIVLGTVNPERFQYAIYVYELGLEYRYLSENGKLEEGKRLWLKVSSVNPRQELLTFSLASRSGGIHAQQFSARAA